MYGRGLLRGWWGPVGPKVVLDQMAAPVSEIMDTSSIKYCSVLHNMYESYHFFYIYGEINKSVRENTDEQIKEFSTCQPWFFAHHGQVDEWICWPLSSNKSTSMCLTFHSYLLPPCPGHTVAYLVETLCHKPGSRRFEPQMRWIFSIYLTLQSHYGPRDDSASNRNECQESSWGQKAASTTIYELNVWKCGSLNLSQP
jgi:hypothetical protein